MYFHEGTPDLQAWADDALAAALACGSMLVTSEISIIECLYGAYRQGKPKLVETYGLFFSQEGTISVIPVTAAVLDLAARLGAELGLETVDAIHVASAVSLGCETLLTNDKTLRAPAGLAIKGVVDRQ